MKTIAQFVQDGISNLADLQDALQTAMQLEFATIPPYLCAQWSVNNDPSGVGNMIQDIVVEEMFHFALAGNMLTAIGKTPSIANAAFVPSYPTHVLPGGIPQRLAVDLRPLSLDQLQVFMQIENPEFPPVALLAGPPPATIGAFYDTISTGFTVVNPTTIPNAPFVNMGEAVQIKTIADAQAAITRIKIEGEGTQGSPDEPPGDSSQFAHYYRFKEIFTGKTLVQNNGKWSFTGTALQFPTVFAFQQSTVSPDPSAAFNQAMAQLLAELELDLPVPGMPHVRGEDGPLTWFLLLHRAVSEIRCELSLPSEMSLLDGRITRWQERIIISAIPLDGAEIEVQAPQGPDLEIDVKRKA